MATDAGIRDPRWALLPESAFTRVGGQHVALAPLPFQTLVNLRGDPHDRSFVDAVRDAIGVDALPAPNRWVGADERSLIGLGPDEWLLVAPDGEAKRLESGLCGQPGENTRLSAVDVSSSYTGFRLCGARARDVLAKGCSLDLDRPAFAAGSAAQTLLAQAQVLLTAVAEDGIEIRVRNSFARYLFAWLDDAMAEFRD